MAGETVAHTGRLYYPTLCPASAIKLAKSISNYLFMSIYTVHATITVRTVVIIKMG